jgi:hypothetical protein
MNRLITAIVVILLSAATSCKKSKDTLPPPSPSGKVLLAKIEYPASGGSMSFNYNEAGRLVKITDGGVVSNYTVSPFGYEWYNNGIKQFDYTNIIFAGNRVTSFFNRKYKTDGTIAWAEKHNFEYDASGYQVKKAYSDYVYTSEIFGGNTIKQTIFNSTDGTSRVKTIEYYTDKQDKLNINFFERWSLDHFLSDIEAVGKKNLNLPKKIIETTPTKTFVTEFTFVTDAKGLITDATITNTNTPIGGTPVVSSYTAKFSYL